MKLLLCTLLGSLAAPLAMAQQQLCDQYGYYAANGYYFNNNMWGKSSGSGSGCLKVTGTSGAASWQADWTWSGGENNVKAYPYSGKTITPKLVSQISGLPSSVQWSYSGNNLRANVAYDLFTAANANHDTSSGDYELMIWLGRLGGVYPIGQSTGQVNVGGRSWDLFEGYNGAMHVYSFVASSSVNSWSGDIMDFFRFLGQSKGFPSSQQYLITNQFGTETFTGGPATFQVQSWKADMS